ncbi:cyclic AMP-responsive element-binding protein 3-like protein 1 isoform X2 [Haliotis rufescens]|uniref:cyclic AMP-responsive element-binding protein 3-like protein 1 isoform X2 n=1 Tax=Haliotis rufescens TaxID=6454 RepID=UPI00201EB6DD|nr:cyclic AMP-responsive element-binding protein 3-like protein 1 isoform X2 [Haliotis rufescens]
MDVLYGTDHKLGDMEDSDMTDFLDSDMFNTHSMAPDNYMDNDWLSSFFDDPVLNDKMITDAAQPPCIKSEHSYSLNDQSPGSPLGLAKIEDIDSDFMGSPNALDLSQKSFGSAGSPSVIVKQESMDNDPLLTSAPNTCTTTSFTKQPTIVLATPTSTIAPDQPVFPQITVKQEPPDTFDISEQTVDVVTVTMEQIILPPTPPSSASSDSEGSQSPQRSAPSSPIRGISSSRQTHHVTSAKALSQPLFIPQSGVLILSEEEKRTLVSEGYPIPGKLPLTKQEEKNLKKIRRKIKNKISAQESRRKKKEYLEALEKRVESFNQENTDLRKKVDSLENNNRSLLGQLHKLQALVSKMPRPSAASATQTGTVLMVLVLCFAVFLGSWSPTSLNIGYSPGARAVSPVFLQKPDHIRPTPDHGPSIGNAKVNGDYATPNMKSRMLLSVKDDQEEMLSEDVRAFYPWDRSWCYSGHRAEEEHGETNKPAINNASPEGDYTRQEEVEVEASQSPDLPVLSLPRSSISRANETYEEDYQAIMHPDIAVAPVDLRSIEPRGNLTAEMETA